MRQISLFAAAVGFKIVPPALRLHAKREERAGELRQVVELMEINSWQIVVIGFLRSAIFDEWVRLIWLRSHLNTPCRFSTVLFCNILQGQEDAVMPTRIVESGVQVATRGVLAILGFMPLAMAQCTGSLKPSDSTFLPWWLHFTIRGGNGS